MKAGTIKLYIGAGVMLMLALALGYFLGGLRPPHTAAGSGDSEASQIKTGAGDATQLYTCSMHPQIQLTDPNAKCPLCAMDLIPVSSGGADLPPGRIAMSQRARILARVESTPVERKFVEKEIRMSGRLELDSSRVTTIASRVSGRLERVYVEYTGIPVKMNDHLVDIYSPQFIAAQQEYLSVFQSTEPGSAGQVTRQQIAADKLRLLGLSESQIENLGSLQVASDSITVNSPVSGVVIENMAVEGRYYPEGGQLYTIADLDVLWVMLDAYETDLPWIHFGQDVVLRTESVPGQSFHGTVAFIDPVLDERTRTVRIRVNLPNADGLLKPGMFVRAVLKSTMTDEGKVQDQKLAGKWISPMHPEIVKDEPGQCDVCGMDLVSAESLGYASPGGDELAPLVIPASAPLITGTRAIVYVDHGDGVYESRVIELGPRASDHYMVLSGLVEGELVVTRGNFKIDSSLQIMTGAGMMGLDIHDGLSQKDFPQFQATPEFTESLTPFLDIVFRWHQALSTDKLDEGRERAVSLAGALLAVDHSSLDPAAQSAWMNSRDAISSALVDAGSEPSTIKTLRQSFRAVSNTLIEHIHQFGNLSGSQLYEFHCPMAFSGQGASWIQTGDQLENPFYGAAMFRCGTLEHSFKPRMPATKPGQPSSGSNHNH